MTNHSENIHNATCDNNVLSDGTFHETLLTGYKDGKLVFCKSYNYDTQSEQAQSDLMFLQANNIRWTIGLADMQLKTYKEEQSLELMEIIAKDDYLVKELEATGYDVKALLDGKDWRL